MKQKAVVDLEKGLSMSVQTQRNTAVYSEAPQTQTNPYYTASCATGSRSSGTAAVAAHSPMLSCDVVREPQGPKPRKIEVPEK